MIRVSFILEMMGKPADYVKETLISYIDKMAEEKNVKILKRDIAKPKQMESGLFSTFADIELETDELMNILKIVFTYMPSHIEIISPESISFKNCDLNAMLNEIIMRLHKYDEIAKTITLEKNILENQLKKAGIRPFTEIIESQQMPTSAGNIAKKPAAKKSVKKAGKKKK